jgi:hypothetical protein
VYEVDLPPPEFAQFLVAQSAVQVHHEGGEHVLAPQLRSFREHARLLVGGVGASRRWRCFELQRLLRSPIHLVAFHGRRRNFHDELPAEEVRYASEGFLFDVKPRLRITLWGGTS